MGVPIAVTKNKYTRFTMKLSTTTIKAFMEQHNSSYPYSDIPCTRQGYHSKWLLVTSKSKQGICLRKEGYYVIKSSCLSHDNVQNIIIAGDGIPLPAEFAEVVDGLETWGVFTGLVGWRNPSN